MGIDVEILNHSKLKQRNEEYKIFVGDDALIDDEDVVKQFRFYFAC